MIEALIVVTALGLILAIGIPRIGRQIQRYRLGRTTVVVAEDLEQAMSLAGRGRKPIRLTCTCSSGTYTLADRSGGTVRLTRSLSADPDYGVRTLAISPSTTIDFFPSGLTSLSATDTFTISNPAGTRRITLSPAGQVRILP